MIDPVQVATVWVAEGLLMYLEEDAVRSLLKEASGLKASCTPKPQTLGRGIDTLHSIVLQQCCKMHGAHHHGDSHWLHATVERLPWLVPLRSFTCVIAQPLTAAASAESSVFVTMAFGRGYSKPSVYAKTGPFAELQSSYRWLCDADVASVSVHVTLLWFCTGSVTSASFLSCNGYAAYMRL